MMNKLIRNPRMALLIGAVSLTCVALAATSYAEKLTIQLSGGTTFNRLNNNQNLPINAFVSNSYNTNESTRVGPMFGVGISHTFENVWNKPLNIQLGVAGYQADLGDVTGTEFPFSNLGVFDTLNYDFGASFRALLVESRFIYNHPVLQPFALIGLGFASDRLYGYNEIPTNPAGTAAAQPPFASHSETKLAYELGVGIQKQFYEDKAHHLRYTGSVDYRYLNLGRASLGNSPVQLVSNRLHVNLYTQAVMFSLMMSFD